MKRSPRLESLAVSRWLRDACARLLILACLLTGVAWAPAHAAGAQDLEGLMLLRDASTRLGAEEVRASTAWQPVTSQQLPRYTEDAVWLRGSFTLPADSLRPLMMVEPSSVNEVDLWLYDDAGRLVAHLQDGDERPGLRRYLDNRVPLLQLPAEPGRRYEVLIRVAGDGLLAARIEVWPREAEFVAWERAFQLLFGGFHGVMLVMALYNFFLAFGARLPQYRRYTLFTLSVCLFVSSVNGLGQHFLWGGFAWARTHMMCLTPNLAYLLGVSFIVAYLDVRKHSPRIYRQAQCFLAVFAALTVASLFLRERELMPWIEWAALALTGWGLCAPIYLAWLGLRQAYFFLVAWTVLLVANFVHALVPFGIVPMSAFTEYVQTIGFVIETLVLSIGLADLFNQERASRERATRESLALSEELQRRTQTLLDVQREANESLERKVAERTERLQETLKALEGANQQLESLSVTDPLTGLFNRRHLETALDREMARSRRNRDEAALLAMDIDHFKSVNDRFGHQVGDHCLAAVAEVIQASCRRNGDMAVRYGGEEFIAYYPATDREGAGVLAATLLQRVRELELDDGQGGQLRVSISVGIAIFEPESALGSEQLIGLADAALYAAKHAGRDRAAFA